MARLAVPMMFNQNRRNSSLFPAYDIEDYPFSQIYVLALDVPYSPQSEHLTELRRRQIYSKLWMFRTALRGAAKVQSSRWRKHPVISCVIRLHQTYFALRAATEASRLWYVDRGTNPRPTEVLCRLQNGKENENEKKSVKTNSRPGRRTFARCLFIEICPGQRECRGIGCAN